jgi:hypothetical protein
MYAGQSAYVIDITHTNRFFPVSGLKTARTAYLTTADTSIFCKVPDDVLLFSTHESALARMGGRRVALGFGLSRSTIEATRSPTPFKLRRRRALRNFRATLSQGVRAMLDLSFVPALDARLPIDSTDHAGDAYLAALQDSQVCLAYGGDFFAAVQTNPYLAKAQPQVFENHRFVELNAPAVVMRWDSWRFWESLAAGCLTVQLDFAKFGFRLPAAPDPWVHYAPIDPGDLKGSIEHLLDREKEWPEIAERGRAWAVANYAPAPTAAYMLSEILARYA